MHKTHGPLSSLLSLQVICKLFEENVFISDLDAILCLMKPSLCLINCPAGLWYEFHSTFHRLCVTRIIWHKEGSRRAVFNGGVVICFFSSQSCQCTVHVHVHVRVCTSFPETLGRTPWRAKLIYPGDILNPLHHHCLLHRHCTLQSPHLQSPASWLSRCNCLICFWHMSGSSSRSKK